MRLTFDQLCTLYAYLTMYRQELERHDLDALNMDDIPTNGDSCLTLEAAARIVKADIDYRSI